MSTSKTSCESAVTGSLEKRPTVLSIANDGVSSRPVTLTSFWLGGTSGISSRSASPRGGSYEFRTSQSPMTSAWMPVVRNVVTESSTESTIGSALLLKVVPDESWHPLRIRLDG